MHIKRGMELLVMMQMHARGFVTTVVSAQTRHWLRGLATAGWVAQTRAHRRQQPVGCVCVGGGCGVGVGGSQTVHALRRAASMYAAK